MTPLTGGQGELLRRLAAMPFLDRLEMVAVSGWSRGAVYNPVETLERQGLAAPVPHASELTPATRRYRLTADGLRRLAREEGASVDELHRSPPVSAQWRRVLLERLNAVAAVYRLASAISGVEHPILFRWFRAMPMDATVALPDGRVIAVVRQGQATDRTGFSKRLWRLREGPRPAAALLLMADEARLRHARRLLAGVPALAYLALESEAASAGAGAPIWRTPSGAALLDLRTALDHTGPRGAWPDEELPARASLPKDIDMEAGEDWMLPVLLKTVEKRALDLLADWPWIALRDLAGLLGVSEQRASQLTTALEGFGLSARVPAAGRRLTLTDQGLTLLARRDRAAVGGARKRWSIGLIDSQVSLAWRNVSGRKSRQLLRNMDHTAVVHAFLAALTAQARVLGWDIDQLDPPRRASRYFRHFGGRRSVHPDAFGMLRRNDAAWTFFLEWERRAVRPATMAARLAPYLRYYSSHRPTDDHGARPSVLVVFDDEIAQTHFLRVAREEIWAKRVNASLWVSHREAVASLGPLGRARRAPTDWSRPRLQGPLKPKYPRENESHEAVLHRRVRGSPLLRPLRPGRGRRAVERPSPPRPRLAARSARPLRRPDRPGASRLRPCWPGEADWPARVTPTAGSPRSRGPKSSQAGCASSRTPPRAWTAWRSSTSASASRTARAKRGSAWTGCSTATTPLSRRRTATPSSYSARDGRR